MNKIIFQETMTLTQRVNTSQIEWDDSFQEKAYSFEFKETAVFWWLINNSEPNVPLSGDAECKISFNPHTKRWVIINHSKTDIPYWKDAWFAQRAATGRSYWNGFEDGKKSNK